jgi:hypothetical protein
MYARWLVGAESLTVVVILYCAHMSDISQFHGEYYDFDGPPESDLSIVWRLRAHEAVLLLIALWVAALLIAYAKTRVYKLDCAEAKYGSRFSVSATLVFPLACVLIGWVLGITMH